MASIGLLGSNLYRHWFHQPCVELWTDESAVRSWIDVEIALARAQAAAGLIPLEAASAISEKLSSVAIDHERLSTDIARTMHPFVPLLYQLEEALGDESAAYLHWGATTQNIVDTGIALQLKRSHGMLEAELDRALEALGFLAHENRDVPQAGRTHGQHALPITFGFKVAAWHGEMRRHRDRLRIASSDAFMTSMGGAVGVFSAMDGKGREIQRAVAADLGLAVNDLPLRSVYDRQTAYLSTIVLMGSTVEKIASDMFTLQRTEIAEVHEGFARGKVGSSTMAQKRNPGMIMNLIGLSRLLKSRGPLVLEAMVRHDEGDGVANNIIEVTAPEMMCCAVSLASGLATLMDGLVVDRDAMAHNLGWTKGLIVSEAVMMALARHMGRHHAHEVLYDVAHSATDGMGSFLELLSAHPRVKPLKDLLDIESLVDPANYLGEAGACIDDELLSWVSRVPCTYRV